MNKFEQDKIHLVWLIYTLNCYKVVKIVGANIALQSSRVEVCQLLGTAQQQKPISEGEVQVKIPLRGEGVVDAVGGKSRDPWTMGTSEVCPGEANEENLRAVEWGLALGFPLRSTIF